MGFGHPAALVMCGQAFGVDQAVSCRMVDDVKKSDFDWRVLCGHVRDDPSEVPMRVALMGFVHQVTEVFDREGLAEGAIAPVISGRLDIPKQRFKSVRD